ncbi:MAG: DUF445 domain-containing protein [Planctomycetota bacterium]|jgi:uncharacterized membrane protein YheB (UPF0754 family)
MLNKSLITNITAAVCFLSGLALQGSHPAGHYIMTVGLFALSGAITNWLAVHMLFEKVPFLYGSGVVLIQFNAFKQGIAKLMMDNFFSEENFKKLTERFLTDENLPAIDSERVLKKVPYSEIFDGFTQVVTESKFGGMLAMVGGTAALEPMREPFSHELGRQINQLLNNPDFLSEFNPDQNTTNIREHVIKLIDNRLNELTPKMVKEIVQEMIHKHLDWLVVWGGVFGGLIGLISVLASKL